MVAFLGDWYKPKKHTLRIVRQAFSVQSIQLVGLNQRSFQDNIMNN